MQLLLGCDRLHPPAASFAWLAGCRSMQLQVVSAGSFRSAIVKQSTHQDISSILPAPTNDSRHSNRFFPPCHQSYLATIASCLFTARTPSSGPARSQPLDERIACLDERAIDAQASRADDTRRLSWCSPMHARPYDATTRRHPLHVKRTKQGGAPPTPRQPHHQSIHHRFAAIGVKTTVHKCHRA